MPVAGTSMTNLIDSYLLFRIRTKQDPEAFARIYDRYVEAIFRFAVLKLPTREEAQDVTAETFTRAWQYVSEHPDVGNIRALLYRIARNLVADHYRRTHGMVSLDAVTIDQSGASTPYEEPGDKGREQLIVEARADLALVLRQLERLKEDYRDVLMLRLVDDLPFGVIAEVLGKTPGNVRVIYHRAIKALNETEPNP